MWNIANIAISTTARRIPTNPPDHVKMIMRVGFESPGHAQRFLSAYGPIAQHFRPRRHRLSTEAYRQEMVQRFQSWQEVTGLAAA